MPKNPELTLVLIKFQRELTKVLAELDGGLEENCYLKFNRENWVRLLNLKVWSRRYKVPIRLILEILLKGYYHNVRRYKQKAITIGLSPAVLTGPTSQRTLELEIRKRFPNRENEMSWNSNQVSKILAMVSTGKPLSPETLLEDYHRHIQYKRELLISGTKEFQRPWRGNPFGSKIL